MTDTTSQASTTRSAGNPGRVLITGGASGLGAAVAHEVIAAGGEAIVLDIAESPVEGAISYIADVSDTRRAEETVREVIDKHGDLDAVVTAAGIDRCGKLADIDATEWEKVVGVNLLGTVAVVRASLASLERVKGRVVTVASSLALKAVSDATAYCASKFGVLGFSRALAAETKGSIGVTTLVPSGMNTHFFDDRDEQYKPQDDSRLNDPAAVARAVLFALGQPDGCEIRELVICHELEDSWP